MYRQALPKGSRAAVCRLLKEANRKGAGAGNARYRLGDERSGVLNIYKNLPGGNHVQKHKTKDIEVVGEVYLNQLNKLKREAKLHRLKSQPIFSEASQTEWGEPCDFPTEISVFPM